MSLHRSPSRPTARPNVQALLQTCTSALWMIFCFTSWVLSLIARRLAHQLFFFLGRQRYGWLFYPSLVMLHTWNSPVIMRCCMQEDQESTHYDWNAVEEEEIPGCSRRETAATICHIFTVILELWRDALSEIITANNLLLKADEYRDTSFCSVREIHFKISKIFTAQRHKINYKYG